MCVCVCVCVRVRVRVRVRLRVRACVRACVGVRVETCHMIRITMHAIAGKNVEGLDVFRPDILTNAYHCIQLRKCNFI